MDLQPELPLPLPPLRPDQLYVPARMVNEFQYCPRLAYLEWVQGEWAELADTVEGRGVHRRVDGSSGELPEAEAIGDDARIHVRSVTLSSDRLGLIAKLDLVEVEDGSVVPVDYKRGKRPHLRTAQYRASFDPVSCLRLARGLVASKLRNCRILLRRNTRADTPAEGALGGLRRAARAVNEAKTLGEHLGVEGNGAAIYFASLGAMLRGGDGDGPELPRFEFENRNRRPATDPVNAMLSFAYAMLVRELTAILAAVGFDPYRGFYHQPRYGRPAPGARYDAAVPAYPG